MKRLSVFCLLISFFFFSFAQKDTLKSGEKNPSLIRENPDSIVHHRIGWKNTGLAGINFSQSSYTNWASGGQNSISGTALFNLLSVYKNGGRITFENKIDFSYGRTQIGPENRKSDDKIDVSTKYGRTIGESKWLYTVQTNFKSQFDRGYNYPNDSVFTSRFLTPGYFVYALGLDYKPNDDFSLFISPLSGKTTIVNDQPLADAGAFGVEKAVLDTAGNVITPGKRYRSEFGGSLTLGYTRELSKSIKFSTTLKLFSNYLQNPGNVDVNWETLLSFKVNKFISATIATELIYDDDILVPVDKDNDGVKESSGPRLQFKEVLSLGFSYKF